VGVLNQEDRIRISAKVASIPTEDAQASEIIQALEQDKQEAIKVDNANRNFIENLNQLIHPYQRELSYIDGNIRTQLTEQHMINSAKRIGGNFLFPNESGAPTPSIPDGIWKNFQSFAGNIAVGRNYLETFGNRDHELSKIPEILTLMDFVETFSDVTRVTGQKCTVGSPSDTVEQDTDIHDAMDQAKILIQELRDIIANQRSNIVTSDPDVARQQLNNIAISNIDTIMLPAIDGWLMAPDFDPVGGTSCPIFNNTDLSNLDDTKFKPSIMSVFRNIIENRLSFTQDRRSQILGFLGGVSQTSDGEFFDLTGLYGQRYRFIDIRMNLMTGTLNAVFNLEMAIKAQGQIADSNENFSEAYSNIILVTRLMAPSNGTSVINVNNSSGFLPGDIVYIVAGDKIELRTSIKTIQANRIVLANDIPTGYKEDKLARIYKVLV
jgi:hypothetical protein